jgi:hypothetical protein
VVWMIVIKTELVKVCVIVPVTELLLVRDLLVDDEVGVAVDEVVVVEVVDEGVVAAWPVTAIVKSDLATWPS